MHKKCIVYQGEGRLPFKRLDIDLSLSDCAIASVPSRRCFPALMFTDTNCAKVIVFSPEWESHFVKRHCPHAGNPTCAAVVITVCDSSDQRGQCDTRYHCARDSFPWR